MESSASGRVLREPALLYLILRHLSQQDLLLRAQRVCRGWHETVSTDSRLLAIMWLHPGIPVDRADVASTQINPLLQKTFPMLFDLGFFMDDFTNVGDSATPFIDMQFCLTPARQRILKYHNASWRRMLPCLPALDRLLVNVLDTERGELMWLDFRNQNDQSQDPRPAHPPWLTSGLLYDIMECAWHQANPWRVHHMFLDLPSASLNQRQNHEFVPPDAIIPENLRVLAKSRPGLVRLHVKPDTRSEAERLAAYEASCEKRIRRHERNRGGPCGTEYPICKDFITDEVHFADGLALYEIEWDEVYEYSVRPCPSEEASEDDDDDVVVDDEEEEEEDD